MVLDQPAKIETLMSSWSAGRGVAKGTTTLGGGSFETGRGIDRSPPANSWLKAGAASTVLEFLILFYFSFKKR